MRKGSHQTPEAIEKNRLAHLERPCSEKAKEINRERWLTNNPTKRPEVIAAISSRMTENNPMKDPVSCAKVAATKSGVCLAPEHIEKIREGTKEALSDPDVRARMSRSHEGIPRPQEVKDKIGLGNTGKVRTRETREKLKKIPRTEEWNQRNREQNILSQNKIWYGGVKCPEDARAIYCEKWTDDLRKRIRAFWNNQSALSGKTTAENGNRALDCHHVYFQKKACCSWDEDTQGYYAWIDGEKYYIRGDPNKFVPLTRDEHMRMIHNKLYWIKFFEDLIEENGGKSYFTKEEFKSLSPG